MFTFRPLETIPESRSAPDSPQSKPTPASSSSTPESTSLETFLHALSKQTDIMSKPAVDQDGPPPLRTRSNTAPIKLRNPSQRVREWIKRSNSTRSPRDDPPSPILEISHLGGGRVGDDEIAQMHAAAGIAIPAPAPSLPQSNSTNPRPPPPGPAQRAEARVTQWIDLYPECLETVAAAEVQPSPHWQPQVLTLPSRPPTDEARPRTAPGPGRARAINAFPVELDATPAGLRPPPLRMTGPGSKTAAAPVRRKPSREEMGRLPRLDTSGSGVRGKGTGTGSPTNKTTTTASPSTTSPAATTTTSKPKPNRRPEHHHQHTRTPSSPTKWKTKPLPSIPTPPASVRTVSSTPDDPAAAAPPTPDSAAGGMARMETLLLGTKALGVRAKWSSPDLSTSTTTRLSSGSSSSSASEANRPPAAAPIGPPKYTRPELIWLHRNYRGELPFLRAWGLDIGSAEDRAEGLEMLRELMLEEEENGGGRGGHERSGSKGSLAGSATSCTGEIEVGFQHHHQHGEVGL